MTLDRMKLSAQTVRDNIAIMEECEEPDDAGYYLQLEHEKFVLECIEKQIPKKPIGIYDENKMEKYDCYHKPNPLYYRALFGSCPCCNREVGETFLFCANCGQALDWGHCE